MPRKLKPLQPLVPEDELKAFVRAVIAVPKSEPVAARPMQAQPPAIRSQLTQSIGCPQFGRLCAFSRIPARGDDGTHPTPGAALT
jgi:hypothetical protein